MDKEIIREPKIHLNRRQTIGALVCAVILAAQTALIFAACWTQEARWQSTPLAAAVIFAAPALAALLAILTEATKP